MRYWSTAQSTHRGSPKGPSCAYDPVKKALLSVLVPFLLKRRRVWRDPHLVAEGSQDYKEYDLDDHVSQWKVDDESLKWGWSTG